MSDKDQIPDLSSVHEGMGTLSAQMTKQEVDRITHIIRKQVEKGVAGDKIQSAMKEQLTQFDDHTRLRLWQLAVGEHIADDFDPGDITSIENPKPNTLKVGFSKLPEHLNLGTLVRAQGQDWVVATLSPDGLILKLVQ